MSIFYKCKETRSYQTTLRETALTIIASYQLIMFAVGTYIFNVAKSDAMFVKSNYYRNEVNEVLSLCRMILHLIVSVFYFTENIFTSLQTFFYIFMYVIFFGGVLSTNL